jgi:hypothetical protein
MKRSLTKAKVVGSWTLKSFRVERPKKGLIRWANKASGMLIYTNDGTMSVSINSFDSKRESLDHMLFYAGTYAIRDGILNHKVKYASSLSRIGQTMFRKATITKDLLTIESLPPSPKSYLIWKRVK